MMPLGDDNSSRKSTPYVTYILLALNILFFFAELQGGMEFIQRWAFVPSRFSAHPWNNVITLFTSMFMHGGWMHLAGNMLYLWIFGDNVEDRLGRFKYILFYLLSGLAATLAQYVFVPDSTIPNLGASGAIAGILGAYILLYPGQKVKVLVGQSIVLMPALVVIGIWIFLQLVSGAGTLYSVKNDEGGVAYMAHIGGFFVGLALAFIFRKTEGNKLSHP
ncbi:Rhomboid family protein [Candidatus Protochlamydia naegleriophila]|uniref:Rhomboid family protein n=1 Tax=Candidatus Protochlamydia naegleriophila TaxID=389348 RepID=A0A0U5JG88_9BACT|nr:rhomboid family intramembrane serine protease [Candidatus Protochlamydia naegleriophila]CUI16917.1 Rhomboid family protein [Candidatus Protochlamydia naegleriophila]